ncbi:hypothetical protein VP1G_10068 [Cytospora mali]|uniref:Protein kinase domain-containing protein n=1 Tax=Cytospora mali TaxID=578113 RepID=A0A194VGE2_CYTMA|nr:hypothetical protein VP1G_10068 [Valsa mali var. pyri (nom. inval.)]
MAKTHWSIRSGIWPTFSTDSDSDTDSRGLLDSKPRYHARAHAHVLSIRTSRHRPFRLLRPRVAQRLVYVILVLVGLQFWLLHSAYCQALAEKYSPTLFTRLSRQDEDLLASSRWHLAVGDQRAERQSLLQNRIQWETLGSGYEGDTFAYNDFVIKVFKPGRSPLRNCVPGVSPKMQWPPELPASLLLGGLRDQPDQKQDHASALSPQSGFLPVLDYFLLPPPSRNSHPGEWYLVTPLLKSGTLEHLAKRLQQEENASSPDEVDARFRPSFDRLLRALDIMHTEHDLCHDDIKMDNIFITRQISPSEATSNTSSVLSDDEEAHWLIADLGNARQPSHPYHSSLLWAHDNNQHADCRVNDVVRLVKSYMFFLQSASTTRKGAFNDAFLTAATPWSQLYWHTINSARQALDGTAAALQVLEVSSNVFPPSTTDRDELRSQSGTGSTVDKAPYDGIHSFATPALEATWGEWLWSGLGDSARKAFMVRRELNSGMSVSEKWAKIFGTMGILPTPYKGC